MWKRCARACGARFRRNCCDHNRSFEARCPGRLNGRAEDTGEEWVPARVQRGDPAPPSNTSYAPPCTIVKPVMRAKQMTPIQNTSDSGPATLAATRGVPRSHFVTLFDANI
jgi:hypothetical protein